MCAFVSLIFLFLRLFLREKKMKLYSVRHGKPYCTYNMSTKYQTTFAAQEAITWPSL